MIKPALICMLSFLGVEINSLGPPRGAFPGSFHKAAAPSSVRSVFTMESPGGRGHLPPGLPGSESRRGAGLQGGCGSCVHRVF